MRHAYNPLGNSMKLRSKPSHDAELRGETSQRERDREFQRVLAHAIWNGDNLPAGTPRPVRPLVLMG